MSYWQRRTPAMPEMATIDQASMPILGSERKEHKGRHRKSWKTSMGGATLLSALKISMLIISAVWVALWVLKPTEMWSEKWKQAESSARTTVLGYNGLDFAVYTFPVISVAILGFVYLDLLARKPGRRQARYSTTVLSKPFLVNSYFGVLSGTEILAVSLFALLLAWTFYIHITKDFKKLTPSKTLKLNVSELKFLKIATRFGLLAEACIALLLLPILRGMALFRVLGIHFEVSVRYHAWLGTAMILFATLHGSFTFIIWGMKSSIQEQMWKWQKTGRVYLAGEIALIAGLGIWVTSLPWIRRKRFEIFYYTHHLYIVFLVFFLFHVGDRHFFMVFAGVFLFGLDKLLRVVQSRPKTCILSARIFPCKAVELTIPKDPRLKYTPTSVLFVKIPMISKFEWHPFSITSSSRVSDQTISVIIKCGGSWTSSLYNMIHAEQDMRADDVRCIPIAIEGPYGPPSVDFQRYDSLLMVAGGIGITPFLSILQETTSGFATKMQLIFVVKKSQDISLLSQISPLLLNQTTNGNLKLKLFVTQEAESSSNVRELLNEFSQVEAIYFDTKFSSRAIHGLESSKWMAVLAGLSSIVFLVSLVCFNLVFLPPEKMGSKEKTPSLVTNLILICSFIIAITCSALVGIVLRWRKVRMEIPSFSSKQEKGMERSSMQMTSGLEEHEIHFGGRPDFRDILSKFSSETGGHNVGVFMCGPESMKESLASALSENSHRHAKKTKPNFNFHPLNFTL